MAGDLTNQDWAEFKRLYPAAHQFLQRRSLENEYAALAAIDSMSEWQSRRWIELQFWKNHQH